LIIIPVACFITLGGFLIFYPVPEPPSSEMKIARDSISAASGNEAEIYSCDLCNQAKAYYDSAMMVWRQENERFLYSRNYSMVAEFAGIATRKASNATEGTVTIKSNLKGKLIWQLDEANLLLKKINSRFHSYPLNTEIRNRISKGKMLLKDSEIAFRNGQYLVAEKTLTESAILLKTSYEFADKDLRNYFRLYPRWKTWIDSTIAVSRKTCDYSIIVDKFSRKFVVYLNGEKVDEYNAELGRNWVGHKRLRGDKATPEGMYRIVKKLDGDSTNYYKALLLNYPNDEDTAKFRMEISRGALPPSAKLGGMIEIHGNGGKGADWTEGCIALKDQEMDSIFKYVKVGTPVTIVGSMTNLISALRR